MLPRVRAALPLAAIVVLGAALRFYGLGFGLPHPQARPDETVAVGHADAIMHGHLHPHFFNWPTLVLYVFGAALTVARAAGVVLTRTREFVIARSVSALAGTATIPVLAALAGRIADRPTALAAALFMAVATLPVRESHFAVTDTVMTLLVTTSLALMTRAVDTRRTRDVALAGAAGGLATSAKYSAAAILAVVLAAPGVGAAAAFVATWAIAFVAGSPFIAIDPRAFLADFAYERAHLGGGHTVSLARGWIQHLVVTLPAGTGWAMCAAAAAGLALAAWRGNRRLLVPALFAVGFYVSIGAGRTVFFRYALPLVPMVCLAAAIAATAAGRAVALRARIPASVAIAAIALAIAVPSLAQSARLDRLLARTDSRVVAETWLAGQLTPQDTLYDSGGNYSRLWFDSLEFHEWRYDAAARSFHDPEGRTPGWIVLHESPLPEYTDPPESIRTLVRERYALVHRVVGVPAQAGGAVYDRQDAFFLPIAGFSGIERPGPTVLIYRLR